MLLVVGAVVVALGIALAPVILPFLGIALLIGLGVFVIASAMGLLSFLIKLLASALGLEPKKPAPDPWEGQVKLSTEVGFHPPAGQP